MRRSHYISPLFIAIAFLSLLSIHSYAQLSPGPLSLKHAKLEGMSNCTQCHSVGKGVPNSKCLDCHQDIQMLNKQNKGYHANATVKNKSCVTCHSDHHGKNFKMIKLNEKNFNHNQTGYELLGAHKETDCKSCHKPSFISDKKIASRKGTYLGLEQKCLSCHQDTHQGSLKTSCMDCHTMDKFKPASQFSHDQAKFKLKGAHKSVDCLSCHPKIQKNGKPFQQFKGIAFNNCTSCHKDEHNGKFGQNCTKCHNETNFKQIAKSFNTTFNHNTTRYPLEGQHTKLACKACHKTESFTNPIQFNLCKNCHQDYHKGEFENTNPKSDCKDCHELNSPFTQTTFDIKRHEQSNFKLNGAHLATACIACHQKEPQWKFKNIGTECIDCHKNNHENQISEKYYPKNNCTNCHNESNWTVIQFDHKKTGYLLEGKHAITTCRDCHFKNIQEQNSNNIYTIQRFKLQKDDCVQCHENIHGKQFEKDNKTNCNQCHSDTNQWNANLFNHATTAFPLDGKHALLQCKSCHTPSLQSNGKMVIVYKSNKLKCIDCHY